MIFMARCSGNTSLLSGKTYTELLSNYNENEYFIDRTISELNNDNHEKGNDSDGEFINIP
jgi:hypothetical protein